MKMSPSCQPRYYETVTTKVTVFFQKSLIDLHIGTLLGKASQINSNSENMLENAGKTKRSL